jgi:predicted dehydrogenase
VTKKVRVSIVGVGAMGRRHVRVLSGLPRYDVRGVYDVSRTACAEAARAYGVAALDSMDEALSRADLVVFATPIEEHAAQVATALEAGRDVLVEKPIAGSAAEAHALVARAARARRHLFVGHSERFNPVVRALSRLLEGSAVVALELRRAGKQAHIDPARDWGALVNLGVHDLDLAAYLTGAPVELCDAVGACALAGSAAEDIAHVLVESHAGAPGHVLVDRTALVKHRTVSLLTPAWAYEGDLLAHRLTRTSRATGVRSEVPLPADEPLVAQALAIADALDGARGHSAAAAATGLDGARALSLAERAAARVRGRDGAEKLSVSARS